MATNAPTPRRGGAWRRTLRLLTVVSVLSATTGVVDLTAASADQVTTTVSPVVVFAPPAVADNGAFSASVTYPSTFSLPSVSDGVAADTFTYSIIGTNSAGCTVNDAGTTFTYATAGSCAIQAASVPTDGDGDHDGDGYRWGQTDACGTSVAPPLPPPPPWWWGDGWGRHHHFGHDEVAQSCVVTATLNLTIAPATQSLHLVSRSVRLHASVPLIATGYHGTGAISYDVVGGSARHCSIAVVSSKSRLTARGPGTCFVVAHIAADADYASASSGIATYRYRRPRIVILDQSIDLASANLGYGKSLQLSATGFQGSGVVRYRLVGGTAKGCAISASDVISARGAGTCEVVASIAAGGGYAASVSPTAIITFAAPPLPPPPPPPPSPTPPPLPSLAPTISMSVVPFAEGSDVLSPQLDTQIAAIASTVKSKKYLVVDLTPFTDNVFTPAFNITLNQNRALAVLGQLDADLSALHVSGVSVVIVTTPATSVFTPDSNVTAKGRAFNRRVVATLKAS